MNDFLDLIRVVFITIFIFIIAFTPFLYGLNYLEKQQCKRQTISFEEYKYSFLDDCMVKYNNKWYPLSNIRIIDGRIINE